MFSSVLSGCVEWNTGILAADMDVAPFRKTSALCLQLRVRRGLGTLNISFKICEKSVYESCQIRNFLY